MLPDPPCIYPLVGCTSPNISGSTGEGSDSSYVIGDTAASSSRSSLNVSSSYSSSRSSFFTSSRSSSSSRSSMFTSSSSSSAGTFTTRFSSDAQRVATYLITVRNNGMQPVSGFTFTHGPTPSGAIFDPVRSYNECIQTGTSVQCTSDLKLSEVKTFTIAYTVNNAVSCSLARGLQAVGVQTSTASVSTSVGCIMSNESASATSSLSSSSSFLSSSSSLSETSVPFFAAASGTLATQQYASGSLVGQVVYEPAQDGEKGKGKGYKPYPEPRSGVISDYFLRNTEASLLRPVSQQNTEEGLAMPFMTGSIVFLVVMALLFFTLFRKRLR